MMWGGVVPLCTGTTAREVVRSWAAARRLRRLLICLETSVSGAPDPGAPGGPGGVDDLVRELETDGLAIFPVAVRQGGSLSAVAEVVGAFHFDLCDGIVGVGGGPVIETAKLAALMVGQRRSLSELAAMPEAVDPVSVAPCLAVATDLEAVAALGCASVVLDEGGCPFLLRSAALRPGAAAYCPIGSGDDGRAMAAALAFEAGEEGRAIAADLMGEANGVEPSLRAAGLLERHIGPARVLAAYASETGGIPKAVTLAALLGLYRSDGTADAIASALDPSGSGHAALEDLPLEGLARIDRSTLPVDISPVLVMLGRNIPARRRRGGQGGAARGRRTE